MKLKVLAAGFVAGTLVPSVALAAADAHGHAPPTLSTLAWPTVNFLIYAFMMRAIYKKYLAPSLLARSAAFEAHVKKAAQILEDAERDLRAAEARAQQIGDEQQSIRERLSTEGAQISAQVMAQAQQSALNIRRDIGRRVDRELSIATADIKQRVITLATEQARKTLASTLSEEDDYRLRQDAVRGLL